jgi:predicted ABC-type ATPase
MAQAAPTFWLIAGPNGVGKTTFAFQRLKAVSGSIRFVNLDEIARGLSPLEPGAAERDAARLALARAEHFIALRETFSMETTLSGATHLALAKLAKAGGMSVNLMYFSVRDPAICLERIARRVAAGGHDVAEDVVRRRFLRSFARLRQLLPVADLWRCYEASGAQPALAIEGRGRMVAFRDDAVLSVAHPALRDIADSP